MSIKYIIIYKIVKILLGEYKCHKTQREKGQVSHEVLLFNASQNFLKVNSEHLDTSPKFLASWGYKFSTRIYPPGVRISTFVRRGCDQVIYMLPKKCSREDILLCSKVFFYFVLFQHLCLVFSAFEIGFCGIQDSKQDSVIFHMNINFT